PEPESTRYGYGVWRCTPQGAWRADGAYGQFLLVLPEQRAVVTITSHLEGRGGAEGLRAVWEELLPLLRRAATAGPLLGPPPLALPRPDRHHFPDVCVR